jgi:inosine-uridine nucleoside N-ribohydrolase
MMRKVILVADPGIDGAFAVVLALYDPELDVLGVASTAGNVSAEQATKNVQTVVEQVDPPRWPRLGAALPVEYTTDGTKLNGPGGLGGVEFPCAQLHHQHSSDKLIIDLVRQSPKDVTLIVLGPLTVVARAFDRDPELPALVQRLVCVGGAWHEPGNASAVAEFHFYCDPVAARQVLNSGVPLTMVPLDVTRKAVFSPSELLEMTSRESAACRFLGRIASYGIRTTSNLYGVEGLYLKDVLGIAVVAIPGAFSSKPMAVDVETRGELTLGMSVVDARPTRKNSTNVDLAVSVEIAPVREYIHRILDLTTGGRA